MNISRNVLLAALVAFSLPVFAMENPDVPSVDGAKNEQNDKPAPKEEGNGILDYAKWIAYSPVTVPMWALDILADNVGALRAAKWLGAAPVDKDGKPAVDKDDKVIERGSIASFFANHEDGTKRVLAATGTAAVIAAAYKIYQEFIVEKNDSSDEYEEMDVFGEDDFDAENN